MSRRLSWPGVNTNTNARNRCEVVATSRYGLTQLHEAAHEGWHERVKQLVGQRGQEVDTLDRWGWSPLLYATVQPGRLNIVQLLQQRGADVNLCLPCGASPLTFAAENQEYQVCQYLIQCGADCSKAEGHLDDLLSWAAGEGDEDMIRQLVAAGANINNANDDHPPLSIAAEHGHQDICQWMREQGADVSRCLDPLLHCAALHGDLDLARHWVLAGADINKVNCDGTTPVCAAAKEGHMQLCRYFLELGADLNIADKKKTRLTPLYFLCKEGDLDLVEQFIKQGADVNSAGCLQVALENYNNEVAEFLINLGCDVNKVSIIYSLLFQISNHTFQGSQ